MCLLHDWLSVPSVCTVDSASVLQCAPVCLVEKLVFSDLKSEPLLEDLILLAYGVAVYSEVEQTRCDITVIDCSNNLISPLRRRYDNVGSLGLLKRSSYAISPSPGIIIIA